MKNSLILGLTLFCLGICLQGSAQQKQRLSRTELQAKQARLPHKRHVKSKAEIDAMVAKQRIEARENQQKHERMKAAMQQRERSAGNRE